MTSRTAETLRDAALIFLAAMLLGLGYNSMSPLGIRSGPATSPVPNPFEIANGTLNKPLSSTIQTGPSATTKDRTIPESVTWPQARALVKNGAVLVDVREPEAYEYEHINGAVSLPMSTFETEIEAFKSRTPASRIVIVYCSSSQCDFSRKVAQLMMQKHGFADVRDMAGGYEEWRLAEYASGDSPK